MVNKLRPIWLTLALTALIAVGAGYLARQRARAEQVQAPRLPATVVEIPASAIEPGDPALAAPIPPAPVPPPARQAPP